MGYEMGAHGVPSFFLDPGNRNSFLYDLRNENFEHLLLDNYDAFHDALISVLEESKNNKIHKDKWNNLCIESSEVSKNIYNTFYK